MASSYPTSIPAYTQNSGQNNTTDTLAVNQHTSRHQQHQDDVIAVATKLGTGVSTASNNTVLRGTGAGTSGFDTVHAATDISGVLGTGNGGTGSAIPSTGLSNLGGTTLLAALQAVYPVGCIYAETTGVNPNATFGFGTWVAFAQGQVMVGNGTSDQAFVAGATGGESNHTLTGGETPVHNHTISAASGSGSGQFNQIQNNGGGASIATLLGVSNFGGGSAHNNLQPYVVVHYWNRIS